MLDDGIAFVARDHADIEKAAVLRVTHRLERVFMRIAIVLRRLHDGHLFLRELRSEVAQPARMHQVIAVNDGDDLGIRMSVFAVRS